MTRFFAAADGSFVNVDHIVHIEIVEGSTIGQNPPPGWMVRARTTIGWGTAGYGHQIGHLVRLAEKFPNEQMAREWVVKNLNPA
jgi:hypothetical protein